jgi:hypothetical protein
LGTSTGGSSSLIIDGRGHHGLTEARQQRSSRRAIVRWSRASFYKLIWRKPKAAVSMGYARGKFFEAANTMPRDRKDWYD